MPMNEVTVNKVIVHPLVLLSVVDHFNRMGKIGNQKRVVGVLLGCWRQKGVLDVSNSFAGRLCYNQHRYHVSNEFLLLFQKSPLMRTTKTNLFGFWTTIIWIACTECSKKSMPENV